MSKFALATLCAPAVGRHAAALPEGYICEAGHYCLGKYLDEVDVAVSTHACILWPGAWRLPHQDAVVYAFGHNKVAKPPHAVHIAHMHLHWSMAQ